MNGFVRCFRFYFRRRIFLTVIGQHWNAPYLPGLDLSMACQGGHMHSQKGPKDTGTCAVCWATFKIQRATGRLHKHGHRNNPCPGSDTLPVTSTNHACHPAVAPSHSQASASAGDGSALSHPPWVPLVNRIPRAAKASSGALLLQILRKIIEKPNDKVAWHELLHFGPVILAKPKRGGSKRNLSNVINSRVAAWNKDALSSVHSHTTDGKAARKSTENNWLAAAVSSKLEAGNFRAAISDAPAQVNHDT